MSAASKSRKGHQKRSKGAPPSKRERADDVVAREAADESEHRDEASAEDTTNDGADAPTSGETPYRGSSPGDRADSKQPTIWQRATYRWTAITTVMAALLILYTYHPYYKNAQFTPFKSLYTPAFVVWLCVGVFYVKATLEKFHERRYTMRDSGLHLVMLARAWQNRRFWRVAKNRRVRTTLLGIIVKAFFTPLMAGFVSGHLNSIARSWLTHKHLPPMELKVPNGTGLLTSIQMWWTHIGSRLPELIPSGQDLAGLLHPGTWTHADWSWGLDLAYNVIFAVDCGFALIGYATESRWMGNKTRSVEPTAFGWLVCISCYPPFNNVLGTYLPLEAGPPIVTGEVGKLALRGAVVVLFAFYASATVAFGFKFSNLTNRGIVSRGPYRFVRHPAYLCKCLAWWCENMPTMTLTKAFFLSLLCGWYALRARTEERHLSMDPEYVAYKKKTPWVLLPGVY